MSGSSPNSAPVMNCGSLGFLGAPDSYNFDYISVFDNAALSGPLRGVHLLSAQRMGRRTWAGLRVSTLNLKAVCGCRDTMALSRPTEGGIANYREAVIDQPEYCRIAHS